MITVKVLELVQVCHDGVVYAPGEHAEVPDAVAGHWLRSGWVEKVPDTATDASKAAKAPPAPPPKRSGSARP